MCGLLSTVCVNITPVIHSLHLQRLCICINDLFKPRNFRFVVPPNLYKNGCKMNFLFHLCLPYKCTCMRGLRLALYLAVFLFQRLRSGSIRYCYRENRPGKYQYCCNSFVVPHYYFFFLRLYVNISILWWATSDDVQMTLIVYLRPFW